jgi:hypothetical protein
MTMTTQNVLSKHFGTNGTLGFAIIPSEFIIHFAHGHVSTNNPIDPGVGAETEFAAVPLPVIWHRCGSKTATQFQPLACCVMS